MAEIYKDTITPVKTKIFWGGEIVNADNDLVQAVVYDITEDPTIVPAISPTVAITSSRWRTSWASAKNSFLTALR